MYETIMFLCVFSSTEMKSFLIPFFRRPSVRLQNVHMFVFSTQPPGHFNKTGHKALVNEGKSSLFNRKSQGEIKMKKQKCTDGNENYSSQNHSAKLKKIRHKACIGKGFDFIQSKEER